MNHIVVQNELPADILVVEDSETQAGQIAHLLETAGYRVRVARNGREGLAQARAVKPTLVVSDIAMPEMDGFAMCQEIKKDIGLKDVPVILLTALTSLYDVIKGLDCGADNFIRKPLDGKYLLGRIRFILANRALRSNDRVELGMKINLGGQTHFVTAERQQIFDLLISTYEEAIQMTEELRLQQSQIAHSYQSLHGLYRIAEALNPTITEKAVAEMALERALDLPGVIGGCVLLLDAEGGFRCVAAQDFGTAAQVAEEKMDCACRSRLLAGDFRVPQVIEDCAMLRQDPVAYPNGGGHVSVPLAVGDRTLGVMNLLIVDTNAVSEEDLRVLDTVGNQIAIALERANLYAHMEALVKERTEALQAERNLLSAVVNTTGALVFLVDLAGRIVMFNPACEQTLGWKAEEVQGRTYWELFLDPERAKVVKSFFGSLDITKLPAQIQGDWIARDGSRRNIIWSTTFLKNSEGSVEYFLGNGIDVTELRLAEERVRYLSNFDTFTGLPNRILLRDRVRFWQERVSATRKVMGFLVIHFDRLTLIRESLGIRAEQDLLLQITRRLKEWASADDSIARYGDTSFAAIAVRSEPQDLSVVARQILAAMSAPFQFEQQDVHIDAHIGITIFPNDGEEYDTLSQGAEAAMRRALTSRTERCEFYRPELNREANDRFKLENALRRALERDEFLLHYQPQVSLKTGRIVGFEALLRWQQPKFGLVPPGRFIGLAEDTGLILPIGAWVLRTACEQIRAWRQAGLPPVPIAVNLSAKQFSMNIADTVKSILEQTGVDPSLIELELTETVSMEDPENTIQILRTLKEMGVLLAIDDFGTGYSNLNYLKRFPVDKLKLDQSFVRDLISDPDDLSISHAMIAMAHSLRLTVIAEGVETEGQLALLAQHGCDEIQGYFFSRPVDAASAASMLSENKSLALATLERRPYRRTVLIVSGGADLAAPMRDAMTRAGFTVFQSGSAAQAFEVLAAEEVGAVLFDGRIRDMDGVEFLARAGQMYPIVVRMISMHDDDLRSIGEIKGIFRIVPKPWKLAELLAALGDALAEFESKAKKIPLPSQEEGG
ncbi:EAL domain-containing protein [Noviherbaspirillum sp.]|uniref:EAL domain-containing protein n=1 Tax=Noviherbaspirillum sp. TaxID=1926288 RepID=UPI002B46404C|nr:EAL domain-containing protein [Noviherbaspirillum sp.]HJV80128.1 EAL domain-containing protein [Noviherbaspirillum sp.]